jgi:RNA polymerase-binding protein DksA
MAKSPRKQQDTDATRIGASGSGKLDQQAPRERAAPPAPPRRPTPARDVTGSDALDLEAIREHLEKERDEAAVRLRDLGVSPDADENEPRARIDIPRDEGDQAQQSERQDMTFATRERLADRINRLSAALGRIDGGTYGECAECGNPIDRGRLAAMPEAATCLACQERREREGGTTHAA